MVAAAASGGAAAQTEAEFVDLFISSAVDAYSAEQRALLRAHAQPEELTVLRGETLGAAVARQCLGADAGYRGDFAKRFYALNPGATVVGGDALLDARLAGSERILAPFCARNSAAKAAAAPRAPAQNGALSLDGVDWATTSSERVDWGATGWGLPAGKTPPHAGSPWPWPRTWTADAGSQPPIEWWAARVDPQAAPPAPPPETLRVTVPKHVAAQLSRLGGGAPSEEPAAAVSARGSLEVLAAGPRVGECAIGDEPARIGPVDLGRMLRIWAMNAYLRRRKGLTAGLQAPRVFIADSGLLSPSAGGVSLPHLAAPQRAHREYPHARHGLQVASVALGGEALTLYRALMGDAPRLWLFNIVERQSLGGRTRFDVAAHHLKDVLEKARADAAIVSLSVRFPNKDGAPSFDAMLAGGNVLVVAAAGNSGARLGEDGQGHKAYPALFGGSPERPVITVAALRRNGRLAGFSNY
ncbi:MAG: S8 family serine peptidase, partial [Pseudomonadota bacterium]